MSAEEIKAILSDKSKIDAVVEDVFKTFDKNGYYEIAMGTSDFVIIRYSGPIKAASMDDVKPVRARHKKK
jgi:hypothetical protein